MVTDNNLNAAGLGYITQAISISGTGIADDVSSVAVSINPASPVVFGRAVSITASVADTTATSTSATGNVTLTDTDSNGNTTTISSGVGLSGGSANIPSYAPASLGSHIITAAYSGAVGSIAQSRGSATLVVNKATPVLAFAPSTATQAYGTAIVASSLNATATDMNGAAIAGSFVYATTIEGIPTTLVAGSLSQRRYRWLCCHHPSTLCRYRTHDPHLGLHLRREHRSKSDWDMRSGTDNSRRVPMNVSALMAYGSREGRAAPNTAMNRLRRLYFGYIQDTWQASRNLTLMYGGRWEFYPPPTPRQAGGFSNYNPNTNSLEVAGIGAVPKNLGVQTRWTDFAPRVGFSYRAGNSTVVRAGFGISYESFPDNQYAFNPPVRQNNAYLPTGTNPYGFGGVAILPDGTRATLAKGFPAATPIVAPPAGIIPNADVSAIYYVVNKNYRDPYVMSYNFTVQQELGHKFVMDLAYVGNQGRQIPAGYNLNADRSAPGAGAPGQPLYGITGGVNNSIHRVADTNLLGIGTNSNYNSLQVRVIRRSSHGLTNTTSYTWGKAMGYISSDKALGYYNYYIEPQRNYSRVDWDQTHMFRESLLYTLPFGPGSRFLQHGIAGQVFGGWDVGTVIGLDSGLPLTFTSSGTGYNSPGNTVVADQIKPFVKMKKIGSGNYWFDPTAFVASPANRNGNTGQNIYSGPAQFSFDANLTRSFAFTDRYTLRMRLNAFQVTNTPQFNNPTTSLTSSDFGSITKAGGNRQLQIAATLNF